jgi:microcystin degradation protein MlrC
MKAVLAAARAIEARDPDILNINVMAGYSYADVPDCGFSLSAATTGDPQGAAAYLEDLVAVLEANIAKGYPQDRPLADVLKLVDALPPGKGPVLLIEPADNIGGGTPGDATDLLGPLLATGRKGVVAAIADPEAVAQCRKAGAGATVSLTIGGKTDEHHGAPLPFSGTVRSLSDGHFELELKTSHLASMLGSEADMGPSAVVENEQAIVLLSSRKMPPMDLGQLHSQGVRPEEAQYVVVKAAVSHRDAYDPIARASFNVDSAGLCTSNLRRLPYRKLAGKIVGLP